MENRKDLETEVLTSEDDKDSGVITTAEEETVCEAAAEVSPNDVLFGVEEEAPAPKKGFFSTWVFKVIAVVAAVTLVVGGLAAAGVFNNFIEGYIKAPKEQLSAVMDRELGQAKAELLDSLGSVEYPDELNYGLDVSVRLSDTLLGFLNELKLADFDFTVLEALNDMVLRTTLGMSEEQLLLRMDAVEGDSSAGITSVIDTGKDALFVGVDFLTDALIKIDLQTDLPEYKLTPDKMSEEEAEALFEVYENIVDIVLENIGEPQRERDTVDADGKKVKCDLLKVNIDREDMANIISDISELLGDEEVKDILTAGDELRSGQYDELIGQIADMDAESLPEDMDAEIELWVSDGELVGFSVKEDVSESSLYHMELTGVTEISTKILGMSVKFGGQVEGDEGAFTLRVGDIKLGKIAVSGIESDKRTVTVTLSDEISSMAGLYLGADSPFGNLGEYAFILELEGDEFELSADLFVMRGEEELAYVGLDATSEAEIEPLEIDGRECYTIDQMEEWQKSLNYSNIFKLPSGLLKLIMQFATSVRL